MAKRALDEELNDQVRRMRGQGFADKEIAVSLGVSVRTITRNLGTRRQWRAEVAASSLRDKKSAWPSDRLWPEDMTHQELRETTGWPFAERVLLAADTLHRRGNRWAPWFARRWSDIETVERSKSVQDQIPMGPWRVFVAGMPILAEWLDESACQSLADLVAKYEPWMKGGLAPLGGHPNFTGPDSPAGEAERFEHSRKGLGSASRQHVAAIRRAVEQRNIESLIGLIPDSGPYPALTELVDRLPMVDRREPTAQPVGRRPTIQTADLWQVFFSIFGHQPPWEDG